MIIYCKKNEIDSNVYTYKEKNSLYSIVEFCTQY